MDASHRQPRDRPRQRRASPDRTRRIAVALATTAGWLAASAAAAVAAAPSPEPPVSATWRAVPLRDWAARIATLAGRPVIVDRRLDPDTTVTRDCRGEPLGDVLVAVAAEADAAVEPLRSWIRIAPADVVGRAAHGERIRAREVAALPAAARTALAARRPWSWPDGARPRDLVAAAATEAGLAVTGVEAVPHDHLPAASLPPLALAERLDLLLAHYDLRVAWRSTEHGTTGRIVTLEAAPAGAAADARPVTVGPRGPRPRTAERYTLRLEAPLDEALAALAPRLDLDAAIDRDSLAARGILPGEVVRAAVTDATRDQLLDALVRPLGLRWRIEGRRLVVEAPPP